MVPATPVAVSKKVAVCEAAKQRGLKLSQETQAGDGERKTERASGRKKPLNRGQPELSDQQKKQTSLVMSKERKSTVGRKIVFGEKTGEGKGDNGDIRENTRPG